ncbi:hypothetical protein ACHAQA_004193 [Verticillium albo-atrum]
MPTFFISWDLWQQMTFCLGAAIALVFVAGYIKLFWTNRYLKKQEVIDEEKRAHVEEMRKTGLPASKKVFDIPFGVRAIQSGIQVDGIWISRPSSPAGSRTRLVSTSTIVSEQANGKGKGVDPATSTSASSSRRTPSDGSIIEQPLAAGALNSHPNVPQLQAPRTYRPPPPQRLGHSRSASQQDALRQLEGKSPTRPAVQTYVPTTAFNADLSDDSGRAGDRSSVSSSDYETPDTSKPSPTPVSKYQTSGPRRPTQQRTGSSQSGGGIPTNSYGSAYDTRVPSPSTSRVVQTPRTRQIPRTAQTPRDVQTPSPVETNPFATPEPRSSPEPAVGLLGDLEWQERVRQPMMPSPTFAPGDMHVNRSRRSVNPGFEVLPAGTFGTRQNSSGDETDAESVWRRNHPRTSSLGGGAKLQKSPPGNAPR